MVNLDDLAVDILYEIHLLSLSEHLPLVNRYLYAALSHPTTTRAARWLIRKYYDRDNLTLSQGNRQQRDSRWLSRALECGVCDLDVLRELERIWRDDNESPPVLPPLSSSSSSTTSTTRQSADTTAQRTRRKEPLTCPLLPKRIFRHRRPTTSHLITPIDPLLLHLFNTYTPSPNSHRGYPLCRAVMYADYPLIEYLLRRGADPAEKDMLAVQIAVSKRDIRCLRVLVDGPGEEEGEEEEDACSADGAGEGDGEEVGSKRKRNDSTETNMNKRQKYASTATATATANNGKGNSNGSPSTSSTPSSSSSCSTRRTRSQSRFPGVRLTQPIIDSVVARGSAEMIQFIVQERGYMPSLKAIVRLK